MRRIVASQRGLSLADGISLPEVSLAESGSFAEASGIARGVQQRSPAVVLSPADGISLAEDSSLAIGAQRG